MNDFFNSRVGMLLAGALAILLLVFGSALFFWYGWLLATIFLVNVVAFSGLGWWALAVKIARGRHAPVVVYDHMEGKKGQVRAIDGQVLPYPLFPALTTYHGPIDRSVSEMPALPAAAEMPLPAAKSLYEATSALRGADRILLGWDEDGPIWLEVEDLLSIAMAGNTGRGKSRALLWLIGQFIRLGLDTRLIDGKADLRKWLGAYHPVAYTPDEVKQMVDATIALIETRLEEDSRGLIPSFPPVLVIIDELDLVTGRYERITALVELLTKKSRSVNVHGIFSNQSIPAALVGGIKNRGVIVSRICFYCDEEAAQLLGVRGRNGGAELLQRIGPPAPQGLALARTAIFGWRVVAFPFVPDDGIPFLLGQHILPPLPPKAARVFSLPADGPELPQNAPLSGKEKEKNAILALHAQGLPAYAIARQLHKSSAYAEEIKRIIAEEEQRDA